MLLILTAFVLFAADDYPGYITVPQYHIEYDNEYTYAYAVYNTPWGDYPGYTYEGYGPVYLEYEPYCNLEREYVHGNFYIEEHEYYQYYPEGEYDYTVGYNLSGYVNYGPHYWHTSGYYYIENDDMGIQPASTYTFAYFESIGVLELKPDGAGIIIRPTPPNPYGIQPFPLSPPYWPSLQAAIIAAPTTPSGTYQPIPFVITIYVPEIIAPLIVSGSNRLLVQNGRNVWLQPGLDSNGDRINVRLIQDNAILPTTADNNRHFLLGIRSRLTLDGITLTRDPLLTNADTQPGGGVRIENAGAGAPQNGATLYITGGTVIEYARGAVAFGAGIMSGTHSSIYLRHGYIRYNYSRASGGGIRLHGANGRGAVLRMWYPSQVYGNVTGAAGGGVHVMNNEVPSHPHLTTGQHNDRAIFYMYGGDIFNNRASSAGGGVRIGVAGHFYMHGGVIKNNYTIAPGNNGNQFLDGRGGAIEIVEDSVFTWTGGSILNNGRDATGAVRTINGGGVSIVGGGIMHILAPDPTNPNKTDNRFPKVIAGNASQRRGGGIFLSTTTVGGLPGVNLLRTNYASRVNIAEGLDVIIEYNETGFNTAISPVLANGEGGGIYVSNGSVHQQWTVDGVTHTLTQNFGAVLDMNSGVIRNNRARDYGGGVVLREHSGDDDPTLTLARMYLHPAAAIYGNTAGQTSAAGPAAFGRGGGGGAAVFDRGRLMIAGGIIHSNTATVSGGGVYMRNGEFTMFEGVIGGTVEIDDNGNTIQAEAGNVAHGTAVTQGGGGVFIHGADSHIRLYGGYIEYNRAHRGGGAMVTNQSTFDMMGGTIRGHRYNADGVSGGIIAGGGVLVSGDFAEFVMYGGFIGGDSYYSANKAQDGGGAWVGNGAMFNMKPGEYNYTLITGTITGNAATTTADNRGGGGVFMGSTIAGTGIGHFVMYAGEISNNTAQSGGGVLISAGSTFTVEEGSIDVNGTTYNTYGRIAHNMATGIGNYHGGGGVFIVDAGGTLQVNAGIIEQNRALRGGGVMVMTPANLEINGGIIRSHRYANSPADPMATPAPIAQGGGVFITGSTTFEMNGGIIGYTDPEYGNRAINGGGVWSGPGVIFTMHAGGLITGNFTTSIEYDAGGGGVFITGLGSTFFMQAGEIASNFAIRGGGVMVMYPAGFYMSGGTIHDHRYSTLDWDAIEAGGGVYVTGPGATFVKYGGIIGNNDRDNANIAEYGGGVFVADGALFEMRNYIDGQGIITPGTGLIISNSAARGGGVAVKEGSGFIMGSGLIYGNGAVMGIYRIGGGVYLYDYDSWFAMYGGIIRANRATAGGGVYIASNSLFEMNGGNISNHRYGDFETTDPITRGAGVNISEDAEFLMRGGTIGGPTDDTDAYDYPIHHANIAQYGGGIWVGNMANFNLEGTDPKRITGNKALYNGGGIWVSYNGFMTMDLETDNTYITFNRAEGLMGMGGGIYTQRYEYDTLLLMRVPGATLGPGETYAYSNLSLAAIEFSYNGAYFRYVPPVNAWEAIPAGAFTGTSQPPNPVRFHPLNNYDINFRIDEQLFEFFKAFDDGFGTPLWENLLEGARFKLFRADAYDWPTGSAGFISLDSDGNPSPSPPWTAVPPEMIVNSISQSGPGAEPVAFFMIPGFYYQLIEYRPPGGFQLPLGQWRLWIDEHGSVHFRIVGGIPTPGFIYDEAGHYGVHWFLLNWPDFVLPLTGGIGGTHMFTFVGSLAIVMAGLVVIVLHFRKRNPVEP